MFNVPMSSSSHNGVEVPPRSIQLYREKLASPPEYRIGVGMGGGTIARDDLRWYATVMDSTRVPWQRSFTSSSGTRPPACSREISK